MNMGKDFEESDVETIFAKGMYCAESVLLAIAKENSVESPLIPRIATGFCSGMARTCGTCGALTGGILAINILHGRTTPEQSVENNYRLVRELVSRFEGEFNSTNCEKLLGCDLGTKEGQDIFGKQNLVEKCQLFTKKTTSITRELLADNLSSADPR